MTIDAPDTPISSAEAPKRGWRVSWVVAAVVIVLAVLVVGAIAAREGDSNDEASLGTQQLASIQQACTTWHDGYTEAAATPPSAWCSDMVGWMTGQVRGGQMMGSMMWSNPDQMRATCQAWLSSSQRTGGAEPAASAWCAQMVDWMTQHMGQWDQWDRGWMMNGPMGG